MLCVAMLSYLFITVYTHDPIAVIYLRPLQAKMNFVSVRSTELLSKYFGQTEASIRSVFKQVSNPLHGLLGCYNDSNLMTYLSSFIISKQARAAAPCVVFFDEFDALAYKR